MSYTFVLQGMSTEGGRSETMQGHGTIASLLQAGLLTGSATDRRIYKVSHKISVIGVKLLAFIFNENLKWNLYSKENTFIY